ncbi:MAG: glycosyltransferase [Cyanothece sp. SIO1E1]|nr:glycosyltransferase [Cyanothece sp. SIO1E1]
MNPIRIMIPNFSPADSFVDNVAFTLKKMGHVVLTMPPISNRQFNSPYRRIWNQFREKTSRNYLPPQEKWLLKEIDKFKPSLIFTLTQSLSQETLTRIKEKNIQTAVWWGDPPANMQKQGLLCEGWDKIFIKDKFAAKKLSRLGLPAILLHEAMNPHWHKPISQQKNDRLVFAGSFYEYRHFLVKRLIDNSIPVELYGGRLPIWVDARIKTIHTGKFIVKEEKSLHFGAGLACVNSTNMREGNSMNCRAFEIAGAGGLQIMENREIISECFDPGKEILTFDSFDELLELVTWVKKEPVAAQKVRQAGLKRALNEHTYQHRLTFILKELDAIRQS